MPCRDFRPVSYILCLTCPVSYILCPTCPVSFVLCPTCPLSFVYCMSCVLVSCVPYPLSCLSLYQLFLLYLHTLCFLRQLSMVVSPCLGEDLHRSSGQVSDSTCQPADWSIQGHNLSYSNILQQQNLNFKPQKEFGSRSFLAISPVTQNFVKLHFKKIKPKIIFNISICRRRAGRVSDPC